MKFFLITIASVLSFNAAFAQDTLYSTANKFKLTKIIEINKTAVHYKKYNNIDGPTYKIPIQDIYKIIYKNGSTEYFNLALNKKHTLDESEDNRGFYTPRVERIIRNKKKYPNTKNHHLLSSGIYIQDIYTGQIINMHKDVTRADKTAMGFFIQYDRLLFKEIIGINIAPMIGLNQNQLGLKTGLKVYPKYFGRTRFGIGINYAIYKQAYNKLFMTSESDMAWPRRTIVYTDKNALVGNISLASNFLFHINTQTLLQFSADIGGPIHYNKTKNLPSNWTKPDEIYGTYGMLSLGIVRRF